MLIKKLLLPLLLIPSLLSSALASAEYLPDFTTLVEEKGKAVVNISTKQKSNGSAHGGLQIPDLPEDSPFHDFFEKFFRDLPQQSPDPGYNVQSLGSGFIISADGYVMTSAHVVENAEEIIVRMTDRSEKLAKVIGMDKRSDVALLKIEGDDLPYLKAGDPQQLKVGEWVLAIGSPFGFENTATAGIVSAKRRSLPNENYIPFIQSDVAINPGNSGGPLFNMKGEVIGINAQIYSRSGGYMGLAFSVPIDLAMQVAEQLRVSGRVERGWLGVTIQDVNRELAEALEMERPMGALVASILPDSPASKSDLQVQDVIIGYNGNVVRRSSDLPFMVGRSAVGSEATIKVIRAGKSREVKIKIGALPESLATEQADEEPESPASGLLGMTVRDLSNDEKQAAKVEHGVLVINVDREGSAAKAGIRAGDIILMLDKRKTATAEDYEDIAKSLKSGRSVAVLVRREGGSQFLVIKP